MADLNTQYQGFVETADIAAYKRFLYPIIWRTPSEEDINNLLSNNPDLQAKVDNLIQLNQSSASTVAAVKVAYSGTTQAERVAWITERLKAIQTRADFIKAVTDRMISNLKDLGVSDAANIFLGVWTTVFTIGVPVYGGLISSAFNALVQSGSKQSIAREQEKLQNYYTDIQQLAAIKAELTKELAGYETTSNAATPWPTWYYFVGAGLLMLLFFWYRSKRAKRRKR